MGPIALFDKSFLQSLSEDESVWFDQFFMAVVCPIFFLETLANLAKESSSKGPPEKIVGVIASRFPEFGGKPVAHHVTLCQNDLLGAAIPMRAQIPMDGARPVLHQGKPAAVLRRVQRRQPLAVGCMEISTVSSEISQKNGELPWMQSI